MTFERPKVFEPMFDKELLGHENEEIVAVPSQGGCHYDNGAGAKVYCVYHGDNLCAKRPCSRAVQLDPSDPIQPAVMYLFKLEYMNAKLTSL